MLRTARKALKTVGEVRGDRPEPPPARRDPHAKEKQAARALVAVLRRENGWWGRHDPEVFGELADPVQWEFLTAYMDHATRFLQAAQRARQARAAG
jgi:hypothetical protein